MSPVVVALGIAVAILAATIAFALVTVMALLVAPLSPLLVRASV